MSIIVQNFKSLSIKKRVHQSSRYFSASLNAVLTYVINLIIINWIAPKTRMSQKEIKQGD